MLKKERNLQDIIDALTEHAEDLYEEEFAPFFVSDKAFSVIKKMNITTALGNPIKLYDQLIFSFIWYKVPKESELGFVEHEYHMNTLIFKEEEIRQVSEVILVMNNSEGIGGMIYDRVVVNEATIAIYSKGIHVVNCLHDDYCEFLGDANNPHAMYYLNYILNGQTGADDY